METGAVYLITTFSKYVTHSDTFRKRQSDVEAKIDTAVDFSKQGTVRAFCRK